MPPNFGNLTVLIIENRSLNKEQEMKTSTKKSFNTQCHPQRKVLAPNPIGL